ncbi:MAG: hypothetical protein QHH14_08705 [Clostridiales bacterium]|nr:hypothetical protein [Clostridiales bacterium]
MISLRSQVTRKIPKLFFLNPQETLYVNELSRTLGLDKRNLVKKLHEQDHKGILKSEKRGNLRLYGVNPEFPLYHEYRKNVLKTIRVEERLIRSAGTAKKEIIYVGFNKFRAIS